MKTRFAILMLIMLLAVGAKADGNWTWIPGNSWGAKVAAVRMVNYDLIVNLEGDATDYALMTWIDAPLRASLFAALLDAQKNGTLVTLHADPDLAVFQGARFIANPPTALANPAGSGTASVAPGSFDLLGRDRSAAKGAAFHYLLPTARR